jgi:hypothetical protein
MKFIFETINIDLLSRRVREEEAKNSGRRVTRIVLTNNEWSELMRSRGYKEGDITLPTFRFMVRRDMPISPWLAPIEPLPVDHIEVVPERYNTY